jgi:DNA-directed RNA polymerase subunit L
MKFNVIEETKNRLVFELEDESHTFCNILKTELNKVKGVEAAAYDIDHPLTGKPKFLIETKGIEPRKAIKEALKNITAIAKDFKKEVSKL